MDCRVWKIPYSHIRNTAYVCVCVVVYWIKHTMCLTMWIGRFARSELITVNEYCEIDLKAYAFITASIVVLPFVLTSRPVYFFQQLQFCYITLFYKISFYTTYMYSILFIYFFCSKFHINRQKLLPMTANGLDKMWKYEIDYTLQHANHNSIVGHLCDQKLATNENNRSRSWTTAAKIGTSKPQTKHPT